MLFNSLKSQYPFTLERNYYLSALELVLKKSVICKANSAFGFIFVLISKDHPDLKAFHVLVFYLRCTDMALSTLQLLKKLLLNLLNVILNKTLFDLKNKWNAVLYSKVLLNNAFFFYKVSLFIIIYCYLTFIKNDRFNRFVHNMLFKVLKITE